MRSGHTKNIFSSRTCRVLSNENIFFVYICPRLWTRSEFSTYKKKVWDVFKTEVSFWDLIDDNHQSLVINLLSLPLFFVMMLFISLWLCFWLPKNHHVFYGLKFNKEIQVTRTESWFLTKHSIYEDLLAQTMNNFNPFLKHSFLYLYDQKSHLNREIMRR